MAPWQLAVSICLISALTLGVTLIWLTRIEERFPRLVLISFVASAMTYTISFYVGYALICMAYPVALWLLLIPVGLFIYGIGISVAETFREPEYRQWAY